MCEMASSRRLLSTFFSRHRVCSTSRPCSMVGAIVVSSKGSSVSEFV